MFIAFGTSTFKVSWKVDALRVALAGPWYLQTLVIVGALVRIDVVDVSSVALTFKAARSVHALTMAAHCGHEEAFIDVFRFVGHGVDYLTGALAA